MTDEITLKQVAEELGAEMIEDTLNAQDNDVYYAAYRLAEQTFDADPHEAAQALRGEIVELNEQVDLADLADAYFAFHRGETDSWSLDSELTFGKYEGETVSWLLDNDEDYADWIVEEKVQDRTHLATFLAIKLDEKRVEDFHDRETTGDVTDEINGEWAESALYRHGDTFLSTSV